MSTTAIASLLGGSDVIFERLIQLNVAAEATFVTENIGCEWFRDTGDSLAQVQVYPGGGWAAEMTLTSLNATPVKVARLRDGDVALTHCSDVSLYEFWICTLEVVANGTWLRAIGSAPDEAAATAISITLAEAALSLRR